MQCAVNSTSYGVSDRPYWSLCPRRRECQLHEVIINLVHNAVEAMAAIKDSSRVLRVKTEHHDRDAIIVAVEELGTGN